MLDNIDSLFQRKILPYNKRPMGHIAHLRNQFKLINTFVTSYDYIITSTRRGKYIFFFLRIEWSLFVKP